MELDDKDTQFAEAARRALRQSERTLDKDSAARLRAAREHAVAQARNPGRGLGWALPAGALAAGLLVFALLPGGAPDMESPAVQMAAEDALEILGDDLDPGFYQDLELYEWLDAQEQRA